jgi:hypothetical protein
MRQMLTKSLRQRENQPISRPSLSQRPKPRSWRPRKLPRRSSPFTNSSTSSTSFLLVPPLSEIITWDALPTSPYIHDSTKHTDLCHHFLRQTVEEKVIDLTHIPGKDNTAGFFTKALPTIDFERLRTSVWVSALQRIARGSA